ncbi:YcjF family protein [Phaeobacter sp. C3_T13_0]|uniref:YcjF family protein n=1 Tax=Phaeobacter cretensis TaxID=3342641 RepID=UPI0039BCB58A
MTRKDAVLFDLSGSGPGEAAPDVANAPPVPDLVGATEDLPQPALAQVAELATRRPSRLARWFWATVIALIGAVVSVAAWDFTTGLIVRLPLLGWAVTVGFAVALLLALLMGLRELAALSRLRRVESLRDTQPSLTPDHAGGQPANSTSDLKAANRYVEGLERFYKGRKDLTWGLARLQDRKSEIMDADALLQLAEVELLAPLDARALRVVEGSARQVATVTALVPLALADVATALVTSLRMIRRIADIYGGRAGFFSSWRLTRAVLAHLVTTGAVAVGDDLLEPVLGGSILSKLSRRFGEGLVNGALSARVGIAAMEVCRPMTFSKAQKPSTRKVVQRALTGLFSKDK